MGPGPPCAPHVSPDQTNPALTALDLGFNDIGDAGAEALAGLLPDNDVLRSLRLNGNRCGRRNGGTGGWAAL